MPERRKHERHSLGLPVRLRLPGPREPVIVELLDISESGARIQGGVVQVGLSEHLVLGFVTPDQSRCQASGQVVRIDRWGQFVLALDEKNESFLGFMRLLGADNKSADNQHRVRARSDEKTLGSCAPSIVP